MNSERVCKWCTGSPATVEGMTFATDDRNCPCNFCQAALSRHRNSTTPGGAAEPAFVRRGLNRRHSQDNRE